jgi:hypothetical protein
MSTPSRPVRAGAVVAAIAALLLSGCGQPAEDTQAVNRSGPVAQAAPGPRAEPEQEVPVEHVPTELPPGDPGLDAPSVPDPGRPEHDRHHEEPARTVVPAEALLDAPTLSAVAGGDWQQAEAEPLECLAGTGWVAERSAAFASGDGQVLQTVATHEGHGAADRAVEEQATALLGCGWTRERAPRLGSVSAAASTDDGQSAVVFSAEGVTVTLLGSGSVTSDRRRWVSVLDLALGNSCAAAPDACHDQGSAHE